jgi:hypothetical protein
LHETLYFKVQPLVTITEAYAQEYKLTKVIDNYNKLKAGHTPEWCKAIEQLFWILDDGGRGYATQDGMCLSIVPPFPLYFVCTLQERLYIYKVAQDMVVSPVLHIWIPQCAH